MDKESLGHLQKGESLLFTFKHDAERFAKRNNLKIIYNDGEFIDDEHYEVKGYKANLYWIAN